MNNDVILLLAGAGISLVSSLATAAFTTLLNYWLDRRAKITEKAEQAYHLMGKMSALMARTNDQADPVAVWEKHSQGLDEFLRESKRNPNRLAGIIGLIETVLERVQTVEEKHYMLKEKVGLAEAEHSRLEAEHSRLEAEHSRLETANRELKEQLGIAEADEG
jgi:ABC-type phosphate transport system auxiliary subunit